MNENFGGNNDKTRKKQSRASPHLISPPNPDSTWTGRRRHHPQSHTSDRFVSPHFARPLAFFLPASRAIPVGAPCGNGGGAQGEHWPQALARFATPRGAKTLSTSRRWSKPASLCVCVQGYFGYSAFRPYQREIIQKVLDGRDCLVVMATGSGKSIW